MKNITIYANPFAQITGHIIVPNKIPTNDENILIEYINEHWNEIDWDEPELDFAGTDLQFEIHEDCD